MGGGCLALWPDGDWLVPPYVRRLDRLLGVWEVRNIRASSESN